MNIDLVWYVQWLFEHPYIVRRECIHSHVVSFFLWYKNKLCSVEHSSFIPAEKPTNWNSRKKLSVLTSVYVKSCSGSGEKSWVLNLMTVSWYLKVWRKMITEPLFLKCNACHSNESICQVTVKTYRELRLISRGKSVPLKLESRLELDAVRVWGTWGYVFHLVFRGNVPIFTSLCGVWASLPLHLLGRGGEQAHGPLSIAP